MVKKDFPYEPFGRKYTAGGNNAGKGRKLFLVRFLCLLLILSCINTAFAFVFYLFDERIFITAVFTSIAAVNAFAVLCAAECRKTEQYMRLYLEGNGKNPLRLIRFHYSEATEQLIAELQRTAPQRIQQEEDLRKEQYFALQNQINPHFLYNTLEAIRCEAVIGGLSNVADMAETLANFFRYTISKSTGLVTLADELKNVRDYFNIQRFRFGERINLQIKIPMDDSIMYYRLPKLILQPIVENAIIHGLENKIRGGLIIISTLITKNKFFIMIEDNGKGMDHEMLIDINHHLNIQQRPDRQSGKHSGIAVCNVNDRLRMLYGHQYGLTYFSALNIGTTVEIALPKVQEEKYER